MLGKTSCALVTMLIAGLAAVTITPAQAQYSINPVEPTKATSSPVPIRPIPIPTSAPQPTSITKPQPVQGYYLKPSTEIVPTYVNLPGEGYGINVLLHYNDGTLLKNQAGISYKWFNQNPELFDLSNSGFSTACPYDIYAPCPNLHGEIFGKKEGTGTILVRAYLYDQEIAKTTFTVNIKSPFIIEEYPYNSDVGRNMTSSMVAYVLRDGYQISDKQIDYVWTNYTPDNLDIIGYPVSAPCNHANQSLCSMTTVNLTGRNNGQAKIGVKAYSTGRLLAEQTYYFNVVDSPLWTTPPSPIPTSIPASPSPVPIISYPINYEGERLAAVEEQLQALNTTIADQQATINQQQAELEKQNAELEQTKSLVQRLMDFFKSFFGW